MTDLRYRMLSDLRAHGYPAFVQRVYIEHVAAYAKFFMKSPDLLGPEDITAYQTHLLQEKGVAGEIVGDVVTALRLFYHRGQNQLRVAVAEVPRLRRQRMSFDNTNLLPMTASEAKEHSHAQKHNEENE